MLSVKQGSIKYHFWIFGITWPGIELHSTGPLLNTVTKRQLHDKIAIYESSFLRDRTKERWAKDCCWKYLFIPYFFYSCKMDLFWYRIKAKTLMSNKVWKGQRREWEDTGKRWEKSWSMKELAILLASTLRISKCQSHKENWSSQSNLPMTIYQTICDIQSLVLIYGVSFYWLLLASSRNALIYFLRSSS